MRTYSKKKPKRLIKKYEHGGPHDDPKKKSNEDLIKDFDRRIIGNKSNYAMDFLGDFYAQPEVRSKIAQNLAFTQGDGPPEPATRTEAYNILSRMYPNRTDEMVTYEGLANVLSDHYGDFMGSMGNMNFEDNDPFTGGRVTRSAGPVRSGKGSQQNPFTMGMRPQQERMNVEVQIDPMRPMSTYVHEMTHATDVHNNPGNVAIMDKYRKRLSMNQGSEDFTKNYEALSEAGNRLGMDAADFLAYVGQPTETLARLNEIRYDMNDRSGNPMNYEYAYDDIPSLIENDTKAFRELAAVYGAENVVEMLNEIF